MRSVQATRYWYRPSWICYPLMQSARFLDRANALFRPLNPGLEFAGVIGSLTETSGLTPVERSALDRARLALKLWPGSSHLFDHRVRHFRGLAKAAGRSIGYLDDPGVKRAF